MECRHQRRLRTVGDTSTTATLRELTKKIKDDGGSNVRVVQSSGSIFWYLFIPLTIIIHPAVGSVSADAEFAGPSGIEVKPASPAPSGEGSKRSDGATGGGEKPDESS